MSDLRALVEEMHAAHVAAHGPRCGVVPGGHGVQHRDPCVVLQRVWASLNRHESERVRRHQLHPPRFIRGEPRVCPACEVAFAAQQSNQVLCSTDCRADTRHRMQRAKPKNVDWLEGRQPPREIGCLRCGAPITVRASRACCPPCHVELETASYARRLRRNRLRRASHLEEYRDRERVYQARRYAAQKAK